MVELENIASLPFYKLVKIEVKLAFRAHALSSSNHQLIS